MKLHVFYNLKPLVLCFWFYCCLNSQLKKTFHSKSQCTCSLPGFAGWELGFPAEAWEFMIISLLKQSLLTGQARGSSLKVSTWQAQTILDGWENLFKWVSLWFTNSLSCWVPVGWANTVNAWVQSMTGVLLTLTSQIWYLGADCTTTETVKSSLSLLPLGPLNCLYVPFLRT